jgi:hypothetical protein
VSGSVRDERPPAKLPKQCFVLPAFQYGKSEGWDFRKDDCPWLVSQARKYAETLVASHDGPYELDKVLAHWDSYACQLVPYISDGKRLVFMNFFSWHGGHEDNLEHNLLLAADGGYAFWQVKYDFSAGTFFELYVNGYALNEVPSKATSVVSTAPTSRALNEASSLEQRIEF